MNRYEVPVYGYCITSNHVHIIVHGEGAAKSADEVVQHLAKQLMSNVEVRIEISATAPGGYSEDTVRTVTENCRTMKFDSSGFEDE